MNPKLKREIHLQGDPVSEGIAIGIPFFLKPIEEEIPDFAISAHEVDAEIARYREALFSSKEDLHRLQEDLLMEGSEEVVSFVETHIQMLDDPMITTHIEKKIREMMRNTEWVFRSVIKDYETRFSERTNAFFQQRLVDVMDISKRILGHLRENRDARLSEIPPCSIVLSKEIPPSYAAAAHATQVGAYITQTGGGNSHAALISRQKGIPCVAGINVDHIENLRPDEMIVNGFTGLVILFPTKETIAYYRDLQNQLATRYQLYVKEDHLKSETIDGYAITLQVNVGNPKDLDTFPYTHDGVGLFRTEYLFLESKEFFPSEEYQQDAYRELLHKVGGRPVVIRVFDLGGDKVPSLFPEKQKEPNPILGFRGIRFLLRNRQLFRKQLRAIFKVSSGFNVRLLLPLISDIGELHQSVRFIEEVKKELRDQGEQIPDLPIGCMIEVPSAVMICDAIAAQCDFLSIGTNDLVQYTLGVDRSNPAMSQHHYPAHPSILRMIKMICLESWRHQKHLSICGEIACNTLIIPLLLGLGLKVFSVAPRYLPLVKQTIRKWTIVEAFQLAERALAITDSKGISDLLQAHHKK